MNLGKLYLTTVLFSILLIFSLKSSGQVPTVQDCLGAIPVCTYQYDQPASFIGEGNYPNEIHASQTCPNSCMDGEKNSAWYVISVKTGGLLRFVISPKNSNDDYDWAVFDLNNYECSSIYNGALFMQSSCNAAGGAGYHGNTGISSASGGTKHCNNGGNSNKWNMDLPVNAGDTYVLCVSNWSSTQSGYLLDFSASTADIFDDVPATITEIDTLKGCSGLASIYFGFNENILCDSVQANDFTIVGPDGTTHIPYSVTGAGCIAGGTQEKFFSLNNFDPPFTLNGVYTLNLIGEVTDLCTNPSYPHSVTFIADMDPLPTVITGPVDELVPIGAVGQFSVTTEGAHTFKWQFRQEGAIWQDLSEAAPYSGTTTNTLTINPATIDLGQNQYRCVVSGECAPAAQSPGATLFVGEALAASASASPGEICTGDQAQLQVTAFGGNILQPYTYSWSSPDGFSSQNQNPAVEPTVTTTYTVIVDDGYNPVTANVTIYVNPLPIASAGNDTTINHGTFITLSGSVPSGTPSYSYEWQPADSLWNNTIQNPVTRKLRGSTLFSLTVTDGNGCVSVADNVSITVIGGALNASPMAQPDVICLGDTTQLFAMPGGGQPDAYTYIWELNGEEFSTIADPFVYPTANTTYSLLLDDGFNQINKTVEVIVNPLPVIDFYKPQYNIQNGIIQYCVYDTLVLDPGFEGGLYLWNNGSTSFSNNISTSGISFDYQTHSIRVTNAQTGCVSYDTINVMFTFTECTYGISELPMDKLVKLFPNPAGNNVTLSIDGMEDNFFIEIRDLRGRMIYNEEVLKNTPGVLNHTIDISSFSNTTYFVRVLAKQGSIVRKLVVAH